MERLLRNAFLGAVLPFFGLYLVFDWVTLTLPIYMHWLFADYGDPEHPGHLKGVVVTPFEFWGKTIAILILVALTFYTWHCRVRWPASRSG